MKKTPQVTAFNGWLKIWVRNVLKNIVLHRLQSSAVSWSSWVRGWECVCCWCLSYGVGRVSSFALGFSLIVISCADCRWSSMAIWLLGPHISMRSVIMSEGVHCPVPRTLYPLLTAIGHLFVRWYLIAGWMGVSVFNILCQSAWEDGEIEGKRERGISGEFNLFWPKLDHGANEGAV